MSELTVGRIQELTTENNRLREANRRLQATGVALERDKLIAQLRERAERAEAERDRLDSINGQLQGLIRTAREQLNDLLVDEDLDDAKLREASEELLPNIVDRFSAALRAAAQEGNDEQANT